MPPEEEPKGKEGSILAKKDSARHFIHFQH